jgi:hypothetical protein
LYLADARLQATFNEGIKLQARGTKCRRRDEAIELRDTLFTTVFQLAAYPVRAMGWHCEVVASGSGASTNCSTMLASRRSG